MNRLYLRRTTLTFFALLNFCLLSCHNSSRVKTKVLQQHVSVTENARTGTVIADANVGEETKESIFSIIGGDPYHIFGIDSISGKITVADSSALDFEKQQKFELVVHASSKELARLITFAIDVQDMQPVQDGLYSYYPFNNNAHDVISSKDGTIDEFGFVENENNSSADFSGKGKINFPSYFDFPERTISFFFMVSRMDHELNVIYSSDHPAVHYGMTIVSIYCDAITTKLIYNVSNLQTEVQISEHVWNHAVTVVEGKSFRLYLNGKEIHHEKFDDYVVSQNTRMSGAILGSSRMNDRFFTGLVDDLRIYRRALSKREVELLCMEEGRNKEILNNK
jgi:hypothetical protein